MLQPDLAIDQLISFIPGGGGPSGDLTIYTVYYIRLFQIMCKK